VADEVLLVAAQFLPVLHVVTEVHLLSCAWKTGAARTLPCWTRWAGGRGR
jgi:hypothetical protein